MSILNWNKFKKILLKNQTSFFSVAIFFTVWELTSRLGFIPEVIFSRPSHIFVVGLQMIASGELWPHLLISLAAFIIALFFAIIFSVTLGIYIGMNKKIYRILSPFVFSFSSLPKVAIIPLVIIWFGIGFLSKVVIIFFMMISPILINVIDGVHKISKRYFMLAHSFKADNFFIAKSIVFFHVLPDIFSGIKVAIGRGVTGIVIAEVFGYGTGLGFLVSRYGSSYQIAKLMFIISVLLSISMLAVWLNNFIYRSFVKWRN